MLDLCCYDDAPSLSLLATLTLTQANTFPRLLGHSKTAQDLYVIKTAYFLSVRCLFEIREVPSRILMYFAVKVRYFAVVSWFYYFLTRAKSLNQKRTTLVPSNRTCTRCQLNWTRSNFDSFLLFSERERESISDFLCEIGPFGVVSNVLSRPLSPTTCPNPSLRA